jgi:adenylyltransferase/sulfurtransferase
VELPLSAGVHSAADVLDQVRQRYGQDCWRLALDRDLVLALHCGHCNTRQDVMKPLPMVGMKHITCPTCGEMVRPEIVHAVDRDSTLVERTLAELGVPPYDIVRVQGQRGEFTFLLADDRQAAMGA